MRCVNDTLPPRPRDRWLLITMRLSMSSFAGTARTLVAVGTTRLASMLAAVLAAAPRSRTSSAPAGNCVSCLGLSAGAASAFGAVGVVVAAAGVAGAVAGVGGAA